MPSPDAVRAWQAAVQVAIRTRVLLGHFPLRGYAELGDQMIRSSESIGHNTAEGRASTFEGEFIRFLDTAARSASELSSQITVAMEYGIVPSRQAFNLNGTVICTRRMIESLRETVQENYDPQRARRHGDREPTKARQESDRRGV
jgi:four helix bundle protein